MTEVMSWLAAALRERLALIADEESRRDTDRHMARLGEVSERIEKLEMQLPANIDPQLRHYLQRRSYSKALDFLQETAALEGQCSRHCQASKQ